MAIEQKSQAPDVKPGSIIALVVVVALIVGLVVLGNRWGARNTSPPPTAPAVDQESGGKGPSASAATGPTDKAGEKAAPTADVAAAQRLVGRWERPDGGYIIEIRGVKPDGKLDASYFNPKAINVSRAEYSISEGKCLVFVELRDTNYPGATYKLSYDRDTDRLVGLYNQPLSNQTFEIFFTRLQE